MFQIKSSCITLLIATVFVCLTPAAFAQQFDAPYYAHLERNKDRWTVEDKEIDSKLAALRKKHGKRPNVIYILPDDIGWGELGCYGGGEVRGAPTPNLDRMAQQGIQFLSFYAEPSCTPTRVTLMTGRHPVRTGLVKVLFPGAKHGLHRDEVTLAELMSAAGYSTAFFGKWHIGDHEQYHPTNNGFDEAWSYYVYNEAPSMWNEAGEKARFVFDWHLVPKEWKTEPYAIQPIYNAKRGQKPVPVKPFTGETSQFLEKEITDHTIKYINDHKDDNKPFFLWVCSKGIFFRKPHPDWQGKSLQGNNIGDQMMEHDHRVGQILNTVIDAVLRRIRWSFGVATTVRCTITSAMKGTAIFEAGRAMCSKAAFVFQRWHFGRA